MKENREKRIGKIQVVRRSVSFSHYEYRPTHTSKGTEFQQANKEDALNVTKMDYVMSTTRKGRFIRDGKPYDRPPPTPSPKGSPRMSSTGMWDVGDKMKTLTVEYHMTHTLRDWEIDLEDMGWPQVDKGTTEIN